MAPILPNHCSRRCDAMRQSERKRDTRYSGIARIPGDFRNGRSNGAETSCPPPPLSLSFPLLSSPPLVASPPLFRFFFRRDARLPSGIPRIRGTACGIRYVCRKRSQFPADEIRAQRFRCKRLARRGQKAEPPLRFVFADRPAIYTTSRLLLLAY